MNYLIVGAGGTGGCIAGFLSMGEKDVTLIARGAHLEAIRRDGLILNNFEKGRVHVLLNACTIDEYQQHPDVVFVCVKTYSLDGIVPFLQRVCHSETVVIPILNGFGIGDRLAENLPSIIVLDGCIYITADKTSSGEITQRGKVFRIVFGPRKGQTISTDVLNMICSDLKECGIYVKQSDNIARDTLLKLSFVSPMAVAGAYFKTNAGGIQSKDEVREMFISLVKEVSSIADALGIGFLDDAVDANLKILYNVAPEVTASMQKDLENGGSNEMETLVFDVVRLGKQLGVSIPTYEKAAVHFGFIRPLRKLSVHQLKVMNATNKGHSKSMTLSSITILISKNFKDLDFSVDIFN